MTELWSHDFDSETAKCNACGMPFNEAVKTKRPCAVRTLHSVSISPLTPNDKIWQHVVDVARPGAMPVVADKEDESKLDFDQSLLIYGSLPIEEEI